MRQTEEILNIFNAVTLKYIFWKSSTFLRKTGVSVESTKIEIASLPYKTVLSKANVKTNRMGSTKWTYHRERSFGSNYFIFLKNLLIFCWFDVPSTQISIFILFADAEVLFEGLFSIWGSGFKQLQITHLFPLDQQCNP